MAIGETLAGAVITVVVRKLAALLPLQDFVHGPLKRIQGFQDDLEVMEMTLKSIEAVMADAEQRSINDQQTRLWLKRLKEVAYEISDMFDDFQPDRLKWYKILLSGDMANHMKKINKKLKNITVQRESFRLSESKEGTDEELVTTSMTTSDVIVGRGIEKESVINILLGSNNNKASATHTYTQEISNCTIIHGFAGVGKTELAKLVFNDDRIKKAFPQRAWVYLRQNCEQKEICRDIISVIENRTCNLEILESIYQHLKKVLTSKCLIVLDNLWNFRHLVSLQGILGSNVSILVTSRKANQLNMPKAILFPLDPLSYKLSFDLVKQVASSYFEGDIPKIVMDEIVEKYRGVPLALKTIASRLKPGTRKELLNLIKAFPSKSDYGLDSIERTVFGSLELTYRLMTPNLKLCFAYCAIFAKGCEIDQEELCHQWIALGLLENSWENQGTIENLRETKRCAEEKIRELLDMSFLQHSGPYLVCNSIFCHDKSKIKSAFQLRRREPISVISVYPFSSTLTPSSGDVSPPPQAVSA